MGVDRGPCGNGRSCRWGMIEIGVGGESQWMGEIGSLT